MTVSRSPSAPAEVKQDPLASTSKRRRRPGLLVDVHNLLGGLAAVAVIVVSVTGIVLNHIDLLGLAGPPPDAPAITTGEFLPIGDAVERAARVVGDGGAGPDLDRAVWDVGDGTVAVRLDTKPPTEVTIDATTGDVLGRAERHDLDVTQAHSGELLGPVWVVLSDFAGVALIVLLVAGVWIWLRRVRARGRLVGARPGSAWLRANWWFHLVGGLVAVVFLIVLSVTGVLLNHKRDLGLMAAPADLPNHSKEAAYVPLGVKDLAEAAIDARGGGFDLDDVRFVDYRPKGYAKVRFADAEREVIVDGADGAAIEESRRWDVWVEDLHSGLLFGSKGWLLSDLGAVLAILLTVNGTYLWLVPTWRARNRSESP